MNEDELKHSRSCYAAEVTLIDRWVGRIFQKVEDLGLLENTMVIFSTDHGFLLGEHGFIGKSLINYEGRYRLSYLPLYEEINHIPLIIYHPDAKPGRKQAIVQPPDFLPTIMDIQGNPFLAVHGESFKDVILGKNDNHREFALSFPYLNGTGIPITFIKDGYAAFLFSSTQIREEEVIDKAVDGYEKIQEPWEDAKDMLFDLKNDPGQQHDIAPENQKLMEQFRAQAIEFLLDLDTEEDWVNKWKI